MSIISICSLGLNVLVLIVSISGFIKIMGNDLVHLGKSINDIKDTLKEMDEKLDTNYDSTSLADLDPRYLNESARIYAVERWGMKFVDKIELKNGKRFTPVNIPRGNRASFTKWMRERLKENQELNPAIVPKSGPNPLII